ncbi:putative Flp pilus assembly protein precursor (CpaB) [Salinisphaera dokdonensis CL-ES53]|uniref:Flp pilus assembly protein (CpaB) n=1 Tax=Salinisphaera dokdonensis CL-ES53 TaxID=1304272 RepID=A0ABV2AY20_9GAMM
MSSSALRTFAFALIALAMLFGVVAYFMSRQIASNPDAAANAPMPENNSVLAVVAVKPLQPYQTITLEDVSLVPISVEPPQYYTNVADVVGRTPVREVATGAPVTDAAFGRKNKLAEAIPPGTQAMSLSISDVIAVGGFVQPGDFVDVLIYLRSAGEQVEDSQARILLEDVRVLAYQEELISNEASDDESGDSRSRRDRTAVLAVPEAQTTRVMLGASLGELRLSLRAPVRAEGAGTTDLAMADAEGVDDGPAMPESVSPAAARSAPETAQAKTSPTSDAEAQRVITLAELARVEEKREQRSSAPRRSVPRRATIEVYEGAQPSRISRPY